MSTGRSKERRGSYLVVIVALRYTQAPMARNFFGYIKAAFSARPLGMPIPPNWVALAGIAITMLSGSGNAEIGGSMTLNSITAVVIGGNAMSGGVGGVVGPVMGAVTLGIIQNIISFAHINTWWETLVKATIIVVALAAPGAVNLIRRRRS